MQLAGLYVTRKPIAWSSRLINAYANRAKLPWKRFERRKFEITVPKVFSFIDSPDDALAVMERFVVLARGGARQVYFDQGKCESIDLCAGALLNVLAVDAELRLKMGLQGRYPASREALEIVIATGLPKALGVVPVELPNFDTFPMRHGGTDRRSGLLPSAKEHVAGELCSYLVNCYRGLGGYSLTAEGKEKLGKIVGEVLGNAEEHAPGNDWFLTGYLRKPQDRAFGDCHISIFNFGPTLAETLRSLPPGDYRSDIEELVGEHQKRGFFGIVRPGWSEDGLWTLYALQEGVSRLNAPGTSRGVGTADMISEFQRLGKTADPAFQPRMCLVSGKTHILFDGRHEMSLAAMEDGSERRVIAFNRDNNLHEPPDAGYVTELTRHFPGTLISLRFYIDSEYLRQVE